MTNENGIAKVNKLLVNNIITNITSSTIIEYDLKSAHTSALYFIKGEEIYNKLINMPKLERNITIGKMIKEDRSLRTKIDDLVISWFNMFLSENKILGCNFLATTPDSILIKNQIAMKQSFMNGKVLFRNKEKIAYSSLFIVDKRKFILFDRMTKRIRVKGLGTEDITNKYPFVNTSLRDLCCILDDSISLGHINCLRKLKSFRHEYINSTNPEIYRSVDNHNKFKYLIDNQIEYSDIYLKESDNCRLLKDDNYMNYVMPLMRSFI